MRSEEVVIMKRLSRKQAVGLLLSFSTVGLGVAPSAFAASDWVPQRIHSVRNDVATPMRDAASDPT